MTIGPMIASVITNSHIKRTIVSNGSPLVSIEDAGKASTQLKSRPRTRRAPFSRRGFGQGQTGIGRGYLRTAAIGHGTHLLPLN